MAMQTKINTKTLRLGPGRLSYPHLLEPRSFNGAAEKYSTTILLPPGFNITPVMDALTDACEQAWGKNRARWPANARLADKVVRKCEEKEGIAGYEPGWHFVSGSSTEKPAVVHADLTPVTDKAQVYAGRWANVTMRPFVYNNASIGVSLGLNNVQLLQHAGTFGRTSPGQDFDAIALEPDSEEEF